MKYVLILALVFAVPACGGVKVATGVSPVADIANAGGKIETSGQAIFQAVIQARSLAPSTIGQVVVDDVAMAVNRLGHAGLLLNSALSAYVVARNAGADLTAQRLAVQQALLTVSAFLNDIGKALPPGTLQSVDQLTNTIITMVVLIKETVGL